MESIGIRELKQYTSRYIKRAHEGKSIDVTSHGRLMARLVPASDPDDPVADLIAAGRLLPPEEPGDITDITPLPPKPGRPSISQVLRQMREEERY